MARPTKLTKELAEKSTRYLDEIKLGGLYHGDLPTVAGLSIFLDVSRDSLYEWAKQNSPLGRKFSDTLARINAHQEYMLIGKGLKGEYNATIAKMLLNVNHGMVEKTRTDVTSGDLPIKSLVEFIGDDPADSHDQVS
jgi:hypothetical protein